MAMVREIGGVSVNTHYFSTQHETDKAVGVGHKPGWYYQEGVDPKAPMIGPFAFLDDLRQHVNPGKN